MEQSIYSGIIDRYFKGIIVKTVATLNGKKEQTLPYMFKTMLRKELSLSEESANLGFVVK
jgi:hypothetical protein